MAKKSSNEKSIAISVVLYYVKAKTTIVRLRYDGGGIASFLLQRNKIMPIKLKIENVIYV